MRLWKALVDLVYPPLCLHCEEKTGGLLCATCSELLTLLSSEGRCRGCFTLLEEKNKCPQCDQKVACFKRAAALDYFGPAATLVQRLKFANRPHLAKDLAAFMVVQLFRLGWPTPDLLIPVPQPFTRFLVRGYNQSELLAKEMGQLLNREVKNLLKRRSGDFPQMGQERSQREKLSQAAFFWKKKNSCEQVVGKTVLLIDDVMTTGTTLRQTASLLQEAGPAALYALAACLA
jgi:ComF family protein